MKPVRYVQFGVVTPVLFNSTFLSKYNRNELYFHCIGWSFVVTDPYVEVFQ